MGRLIVIEGLDGSGKATQTALLSGALTDRGIAHRAVSYPDYESLSSGPVRMYLGGEMGGSAAGVNAYAASILYTADRVASFYAHWKSDYEQGVWIVADRYTTSNCIHQMSKLPAGEWDGYLDWLQDLEYNRIGLPRPDVVLYLDMPLEASYAMMLRRYGGDEKKRDLHERDAAYLEHCREAAFYAAERLGWHTVPCGEKDKPFESGLIHKAILDIIRQYHTKNT